MRFQLVYKWYSKVEVPKSETKMLVINELLSWINEPNPDRHNSIHFRSDSHKKRKVRTDDTQGWHELKSTMLELIFSSFSSFHQIKIEDSLHVCWWFLCVFHICPYVLGNQEVWFWGFNDSSRVICCSHSFILHIQVWSFSFMQPIVKLGIIEGYLRV